jgi:hypothetical protein
MPGFMPGIHVVTTHNSKDVDGRDKPGHDELRGNAFRPSCPALCRASTSLILQGLEDVDARDKRGHDEEKNAHP